MLLVLALAALIWFVGRRLGTPVQARWTLIGLLFVVVLALQIALPDGHALREATGRSAAGCCSKNELH